jgi:DNA-directed RNA polymerase specialized sigma24 family protein
MSDEPEGQNAFPSERGVFARTHWSVVLAAGEPNSTHAAKALEQLCRTYWYPLYAYTRAQGRSACDAQDLTQAFFAFLFEGNVIGRAHPERGRFRSFLLVALKNFLADQRDRARAQKRGGGQEVLSLDARLAEETYRLEPVNTLTPEKLYERRWAITLLELAMNKLRAEQNATQAAAQFDLLAPFLFDDSPRADYADAAQRLALSRNAVAAAV